MCTVRRRKTFVIFALLLVCTIAAAVLECQVHAEASEDEHAAAHEHAAPMGHKHHSSSYITGHMHCLIAVLPVAMCLLWSAFGWFHSFFRMVYLVSPVLLPFIPPKATAY